MSALLQRPRRPAQPQRGQSLVEFTLVFPILLLLLLTVADFGRYFAAGIAVESIARTAAEVGATHLVQEGAAVDTAGYGRIHNAVWQSVCEEASTLPNVTYNGPGLQCDDIATLVCVHDGVDPSCGSVYNETSTPPSACASFATTPSNSVGVSESSRHVEVRVCYRFSTLLPMDIPFIGGTLSPLSGDFFIDRTRMFSVMDY
ncbi:MAG TPA: TadE/TadG family type IV pilus assembly protein [Nonomuraea sp.]|nr:TadE/TadG family type IV pilus assembly protein [Nonomuraea sp.]